MVATRKTSLNIEYDNFPFLFDSQHVIRVFDLSGVAYEHVLYLTFRPLFPSPRPLSDTRPIRLPDDRMHFQ